MAERVRRVVAPGKGAPVETRTIVVPDPGPGDAVVRVQACGVCHTDLHYRDGGINDDFPFLLGCGVMAGLGAALNTGEVSRGDSVAVISCGGVGSAAIAGAKLAGATTIIAVDVDDRKRASAVGLGATYIVNAGKADVVEAVQE